MFICCMQELERRYGALEEACTAKEREGHRLMKAGSVFLSILQYTGGMR